MSRQCPKCREDVLKPLSEGDARGPASCRRCHGLWIPHESFDLLDASPRALGEAVEEGNHGEASPGADARTGVCPDGHGLLTRARLDLDPPVRLERCEECRGIWFDGGELGRVTGRVLLRQLDHFWDPEWRRLQRDLKSRESRLEFLRDGLGDRLFADLTELARGLYGHPLAAAAVAFLTEEIRKPGPE